VLKGNVNVAGTLTADTGKFTDGGTTVFTSAGQVALKKANNNPYMSWHNAVGTRLGYLQMEGTTNNIDFGNEMGGETRFIGASLYDFDSNANIAGTLTAAKVESTGNIIAYAN
jgi:hypothetical protein